MNRLLQAIPFFFMTLPAWALEPDPRRAAESPVALVMYASVAVVLGVGMLYVWWRTKKEERQRVEKEQRKAANQSAR